MDGARRTVRDAASQADQSPSQQTADFAFLHTFSLFSQTGLGYRALGGIVRLGFVLVGGDLTWRGASYVSWC